MASAGFRRNSSGLEAHFSSGFHIVAVVTEKATRPWLPVAAVACTLVLWSSAFVAIRHLSDDFSPGSMSLGRLLVGSLCLTVVATLRGVTRLTGREALAIFVIGLLWYFIYNLALNAGEQQVDAGTASMLLQVTPVLIAAMAAVFLRERLTVYLGLGLVLAFGGVALIALSTSPSLESSDGYLRGVLLCLVSAAAFATSVILQKSLLVRVPAVQVTWLACTVGAICCLPWMGDLATRAQHVPLSSLWWLVYLGVFPTAIAFTTYAYALKNMTASNLGVTTYLVPPITILMGWVFLGEVPPGMAYLGGALALTGVAVARRKPRPPVADLTVQRHAPSVAP